MTKLTDWIDKVAQMDKGLAALLRGLVHVDTSDPNHLRFIWYSEFHKTTSGKRESEVRQYLGRLKGAEIEHLTLDEWGREDPMLGEALSLGARVKHVDDEAA